MARTDVHREMKEMFGEVIGFVDLIPDQFIDSEWDLIKRVQFGETLIPNKVQGADRPGGVGRHPLPLLRRLPHRSGQTLGATDDEVEEAMHYTKLVQGWSTYINGMQVDYDEFTAQVDRVVEHVKATA